MLLIMRGAARCCRHCRWRPLSAADAEINTSSMIAAATMITGRAGAEADAAPHCQDSHYAPTKLTPLVRAPPRRRRSRADRQGQRQAATVIDISPKRATSAINIATAMDNAALKALPCLDAAVTAAWRARRFLHRARAHNIISKP